VQYGLTEDYGSSTTEVTTLATSHSFDLTGLKAGKTYHYRVVSKDAAGNQAVSADNTFKTTSSSGGMPAWAWVVIAIAVVGVLGAGAYLVRGRMAK
jgi:phosphodiesterase/alkaline phosphatase D-like protein